MSKKKKSQNGSAKVEMAKLNSSILLAKGLLATLSLGQQSAWIKKYQSMEPEHLRILLSDVMEEIYIAETAMTNLESRLKSAYAGICWH